MPLTLLTSVGWARWTRCFPEKDEVVEGAVPASRPTENPSFFSYKVVMVRRLIVGHRRSAVHKTMRRSSATEEDTDDSAAGPQLISLAPARQSWRVDQRQHGGSTSRHIPMRLSTQDRASS